MSLKDHEVPRDKFEPDDSVNGLSFPCNCCAYRNLSDSDEPCRTCDHNLNSVSYDGTGEL
jgi:hypothetical protein